VQGIVSSALVVCGLGVRVGKVMEPRQKGKKIAPRVERQFLRAGCILTAP
jgi:hypothetical protein